MTSEEPSEKGTINIFNTSNETFVLCLLTPTIIVLHKWEKLHRKEGMKHHSSAYIKMRRLSQKW